MLFDVHMELGNYHVAGCYLAEIRKADFDYFIRMAKWQDFLGNLDHAIHFMELAADQAEKQKNRELMLWSYTNLADFYGHAGRISDAYSLYKKSLQIQPGNRYALKQIAWIAYSYERNTPMALEIVSDIEEWYCTPDILLLKAQILDYLGDKIEAERYAKDFLELVRRSAYGRMYTIQIAELFLEEKKYEEALTFALKEVEERPTPETYGLLAWVHFNAGHLEQAYQIIEDEIVDKTFEPVPNYYAAEILKSKGKIEYVRRVKDDLMESIFELGPDAEPRIKKL
jgi:tetratricopeptide (TPR) repeat protein